MSSYRLILVLLCIGLLGAVPIIVALPKPVAAVETTQQSAIRTEVLSSLQQVRRLTDDHRYNEALKLVDGLSAVPDKTNLEAQEINQVRDFVLSRLRQS